ncbi:VOC family protein [Niabella beijingensis]|uniref:VOC family protein n=1 Tax=Niabella beijingensis TaxID=2872700 RepID=UPI001CBEA004|nr:VOC family protein [Niabella beijingensis]MBZ4188850.1 VOC family protein [Niabella beijingensis]
MQIDHIAIWADDLEQLRRFYTNYFHAVSSERYHNPRREFYSYFLSFGSGGSRIELMQMPQISDAGPKRGYTKGIAHIAISVGGKEQVDQLTEQLRADGFTIAGEPRTTGDGYYESVVLDPEGNVVELVA